MSELLLDFGQDTTPAPQPSSPQPTTNVAPALPLSPDFSELSSSPPPPDFGTATPASQPRLEIKSPVADETPAPASEQTGNGQPKDASSAPSSPSSTTLPTTPTQGSADDSGTPMKTLDPTHKELRDRFGGRWRMVRSDPYDEYLKVVGIGLFSRKIAGKSTPDLIFLVRDKEIHFSLKSTLQSQNYLLILDKETENLVEKARQSVFTSYKDNKIILQMTPLESGWGKVQEVEVAIAENGELVMLYTAGSAVCRRYFMKLPEIGITLPTMDPVAQ